MDRLLDDAKRLLLAWPGRTVPLMTPMAFWWDGQHVWFTTSGSSLKARRLMEDGTCAMYVPAPEGEDGRLLRGHARVFHLGDPLGLTVHAGFLATAQTALMLKNAQSILGYVVDAPKVPTRFRPANRVLIRVTVTSDEHVTPPPVARGIAPALPTAVPPEIRRVLSGMRRVAVATQVDGGIGLVPAVWGAGFSLELPEGAGVGDGTVATVVVDCDPGFRPTQVSGVSMSGTIATGGTAPRLEPTKVRWWEGFEVHSAEISGRPTDTVVIPD
ncbi:pyridoxamine 5'-phosphate oxidase family protein [Euzebya sp.]|uniref:pyridoxamine 5'-phosphate oxidase family protein n=1 Tax=Euzebya sp. TaxID=1971409 RepID=UPI0035155F20